LKGLHDIYINQFINIAKHSQQLETVYFQGLTITKATMSHILTQLPVKEVIFKRCTISEEVAQFAVETLKQFDHSFIKVELFDNWVFAAPSPWVPADKYDWRNWMKSEIDGLTWSNQFRDDCNLFMKELGPGGASEYDKLYSFCYKGRVHFHELRTLRCRYTDKLWYAAMRAAVMYDNEHNPVTVGCTPSMLYSLIREYPDNLKGI
jgi:hypothetical protein